MVGRDRLVGRSLGADADRRPRHRPGVGGASTSALRPSTAPTARSSRWPSRSRCSTRSRRRPGGLPPSDRTSPRRRPGAGPRARPRPMPTDLANAFAPEHLEIFEEDAALLAERVRTAGCVFAGRKGPPLSETMSPAPTMSYRRVERVASPAPWSRRVPAQDHHRGVSPGGAASRLAPYVDLLAQAEGFPVHGESAMIRR